MKTFFENSLFFGVFISLLSYGIGSLLSTKFKWKIFNPLLVATLLTSGVLVLFRIDYKVYYQGAKYLSYLLTPATICLAVPLYEQFELLKRNWVAIFVGVTTGVVTSLASVFLLAYLFHLDHQAYVTLLPKSITTAIGMGVSEELGGYVAITVVVILITGLLGNVLAETICRVFHITEPVAKGVAIGTSSHAMGTTKALEMGKIEGAMSSLSIVVAGILTVIGANFIAHML